MRQNLAFAIVLSLLGAGNASGQVAGGQQFRNSCLRCHQPPDLNFATDRVWLDQINRTS